MQFGTSTQVTDSTNTTAELVQQIRIAPLWDDLSTADSGDDIYVDDSMADRLTIRWDAANQADGSDVNMSVTLFDNGRIEFDYGPGNTNLSPTVGISRGDGRNHELSMHDGNGLLTSANSVDFDLLPGFADIGAYEFRGSSLDVTPPTIVSTSPAVVHDGGLSNVSFSQIEITFSEPINNIDAVALANYELLGAGPNGTIDGGGDDVMVTLATSYTTGSTLVTLDVAGGLLPLDKYRLTVSGTTSIHDLAGLRLDGDASGTERPDYVRQFKLAEENADFDSDNNVGGFDFLLWQRGFGTTSGATLADGDANGDMLVDAADETVWESQFGSISLLAASKVSGASVIAPTAAAEPMTSSPEAGYPVLGDLVVGAGQAERFLADDLAPIDSGSRGPASRFQVVNALVLTRKADDRVEKSQAKDLTEQVWSHWDLL